MRGGTYPEAMGSGRIRVGSVAVLGAFLAIRNHLEFFEQGLKTLRDVEQHGSVLERRLIHAKPLQHFIH